MKHIFQNNNFGENWFTYPKLYTDFVNLAADNSKIVEVGCWKGKSAAYMAVEIINSKKKIDFYCVDTWEGSEEHHLDQYVQNNSLYELFLSNIEPVKHIIKQIRKTSIEASKDFEDNSLDIVFIDANHSYEAVKEDILHWMPKIKKNGIMAGHDYHPTWSGVIQAVNEVIGKDKIEQRDGCWVLWKKQ